VDTDQTICSGGDPEAFAINIAATGSGALTYQWQSSTTDCATNCTDISGATDASYDVPSGLTETMYYRRIVTSTLNGLPCSDLSNCVTVLINNVSGGTLDADQTICFGGDPDAFTINIAAAGSGALTYQWQSSTTDCATDFTDISGATDATYDVSPGLTVSTNYRRIVTSTLNGVICTAMSNCIAISVFEDVSYGALESGDESLCSGGDPASIQFSDLPSGGTELFIYQ
jgi:hypothetical protein